MGDWFCHNADAPYMALGLDCPKRVEEKPRSNFEYSGRLTEIMHYGNIALHLNRAIKIDPLKREIIGDEQASKLIEWPPPRKGWSV